MAVAPQILLGIQTGGTDADAQAFFTATGITDTTIKSAISQLVSDLKGYSIWTKFHAIYPFVGGTSTTHSYNLKNTAQYQITWNGTVTHNSNGVTGNGSTGYGNTGYNQNANGTSNDEHLSVYSKTNSAADVAEIGVFTGGVGGSYIGCKFADGNFYTASQSLGANAVTSSASTGYFSLNRASSANYKKFGNSTETTVTSSSIGKQNLNYFVLARNLGGSINIPSARNIAWAAIGLSLTTTQDANLQTAIATFQTALSR